MVHYNDDDVIRADRPTAFPAGSGRMESPAGASNGGDGRERASIATLLKDLRDEATTLLQQEVALAKTELSEKAAVAGRNAASIAVGGFIALLGLGFILMAANNGLYALLTYLGVNPGIAIWLAPLLLGVVVALIGYVMIQKGLSTLKRISPVPEKTVQTLKEDKQWLTNKVA